MNHMGIASGFAIHAFPAVSQQYWYCTALYSLEYTVAHYSSTVQYTGQMTIFLHIVRHHI